MSATRTQPATAPVDLDRRFVVVARRAGHRPVPASGLSLQSVAMVLADELRAQNRGVKYAVAELTATEDYR